MQMHPEEGTTLGFAGCDHRWRRISPEHRQQEQCSLHNLARELDEAVQQYPSSLALVRARQVVGFHLHLHATGFYGRAIELSLYPYTIVCHQLAHANSESAWAAIEARLVGVSAVLSEQAANLRVGLGKGQGVALAIVEHLIACQLPDIVQFLGNVLPTLPGRRGAGGSSASQRTFIDACTQASQAYQRHLDYLRTEVAPHATSSGVLGAGETDWRLAHMFGLNDRPALLARGYHELARAQDLAVHEARALGASVAGFGEAVGLFQARMTDRPLSDGQVLARHHELLREVLNFLQVHEIFPLPTPLQFVLAPMPMALAIGTPSTNWPAPLFAREMPAQVRVAEVGSMHPRIQWRNLFVHEAIPGHSLQSLMWQQLVPEQLSPLQFLGIHDTVALTFDEYGAMLNIEGYASHAEERMLEAGFHQGDERLFARVCQAIRASRLIVDLSLHAGLMTPAQATEFLLAETGMARSWSERQVLRYLRCPLQAMTYGFGAWQFADLRRQAQARSLPDVEFYRRVFAHGPLAPQHLGPLIFGDTPKS